MGKETAADTFWIFARVAAIALEISSNEQDQDYVTQHVDDLCDYVDRYADPADGILEGGVNIHTMDGRVLEVMCTFRLTDEDEIPKPDDTWRGD